MATISELLAIAVQHHQGGRLQAAEQIYRQILAVEPNHADAIHLLGVIAHQAGKHEVAVEYIDAGDRLERQCGSLPQQLGEAYRALHRISEAVACYRRALELNPDYAEAHNNLGIALKDQGQLDEAVACCRRALELKPDYAEAHNNLGLALKEQGKLDEAVACYRRALELKPDYAEAHNNLGTAFKDQGKLDEAVACYRRALELKPDYAEAHNNLGSALEEMGDLQARKTPSAPRCGTIPASPPRITNWRYSWAANFRSRTWLRSVDCWQASAAATDAQRLLLHFGLAQVLDARGEYAEAAEHLDRGNALQLAEWRKRGQEYDPQEYESLVTRMIAVCTPDFFERVRGFGLESELPVFVVGLPRSGTTLIEQILASHSQVFGAGEIDWPATPWPRSADKAQTPSRAFAGWTARRPAVSLRGTWRDFAH